MTCSDSLSVLGLLATAVPTSLAALYLTNSRSAEQLIESKLDAGSTPAWFASLPTPVQTYLLGVHITSSSQSTSSTSVAGFSSFPYSTSTPGFPTSPSYSYLVPTTPHRTGISESTRFPISGASGATQTLTHQPTQRTNRPQFIPVLSTGAKAGIGVGAGVGAVGLLALGCAIFLLRRRRSASVPEIPFSAAYHDDHATPGNPAQAVNTFVPHGTAMTEQDMRRD